MKKQPTPPRWAQRLLQWYCKPGLLEDLQGDLNEYFDRNCRMKGVHRARFIYIIDVLKFFRLYTVRKPEFLNLLIHWIMIGSYIKTSSRNIVRNKLFSSINIIGLAVSMSVGLLVIAMISDLFSYDDFHEKKHRIYRVNTRDQRTDSPPMDLASTSVKAGKKIAENISGVEDITMLRRGFGGDAMVGENTVGISGLWADHSFFNVFNFRFLYGDPLSSLKEPYSLVLTRKSAKKIFGDIDVVGKTVKFDTSSYVVTGVLEDIPQRSHLQFEALASFSTVELIRPNTDGDFMSWENIYMTYVYVVLPENGSPTALQKNLDRVSATENTAIKNRQVSLWLHPLKDIPFDGRLSNSIGPTFNKIALWILVGLAGVVIFSACFNYTNLSLARALRRSREVGIRKVIGARKSQIIFQFITESVIIALLALTLSFVMFFLLRTQLLSLHSFLASIFELKLSPATIGWFIVLAVGVGILSGLLPAFFFSRVQSAHVLRDVSSLKVFRHISIRKALIVVQYTFSLIFIATSLIGYDQYRGFISYDLGFKTKNILNIRLEGTNGDAVTKALAELPAIKQISRSLIVTSLGNIYGTQVKYKNDSASVWLNAVDENYLPLHEYQILAGRNLSTRIENSEEREVIVNEQFLKRFDIADREPHQALGEKIEFDLEKWTIVGVVKDFHYETLEDPIEPVLFRYDPIKTYGYINAKIETRDWPATQSAIESVWKKIDQVHPLQATFYDDQIEDAYSPFSVMIKVIGFIALLAICIASMGLFGMVVVTTETRLKEISIRKVLGAGEGTLVLLLSKGFLILLAISALIALPATYIFFEKVVLVQFVYHQPMGVYELAISLLGVMVLAFLMIGSQTFRTARTNPAEVLKNE